MVYSTVLAQMLTLPATTAAHDKHVIHLDYPASVVEIFVDLATFRQSNGARHLHIREAREFTKLCGLFGVVLRITAVAADIEQRAIQNEPFELLVIAAELEDVRLGRLAMNHLRRGHVYTQQGKPYNDRCKDDTIFWGNIKRLPTKWGDALIRALLMSTDVWSSLPVHWEDAAKWFSPQVSVAGATIEDLGQESVEEYVEDSAEEDLEEFVKFVEKYGG
jgi:hypothetical protein